MIPLKNGNTDGSAWSVGTSTLPQLLLKGKQILIADDCVVSRFAAAAMLKRQGAIVFEANDGAQALQIAQNLVLDLILIDLQMPTVDGLQAIRILRNNGSRVPIIAITGTNDEQADRKYKGEGINEVLPKPFTAQTLISRVIHCIDAGIEATTELTEPTQDYIAKQIKRLSGGDGAFAKRMLDIIRQELPSSVKQMREAAHSNDWETVARLAHRMRPCITSLRMDDMLTELSGIESLVLSGNQGEDIQKIVSNLSDKIDLLTQTLALEVDQ